MKKLKITWKGVTDSTGYLFSFAKSLSCAVKNSPWQEYSEDIVATSGFAFRMWVSPDLCPSSTSIWEFKKQPEWVENGGFSCEYAERMWDEDKYEKVRRETASDIIRRSVDREIPAISWDIGVPEWGLITGYDNQAQTFATLSITGEGEMPYEMLGKRELPILSVLAVTEKNYKPQEEILHDTMKLAISHLKGEELCENSNGLEAYPALIKHFEGNFNPDLSWNMEYFLGTFGALKEYAWKYFEKTDQSALASIYKEIFKAWQEAFLSKTSQDAGDPLVCAKIAALLKSAYENETKAVEIMSKSV